MAATRLADVIVPEVFTPYTVQRSTELSTFIRSGILATNPTIQSFVNGGGSTYNLPFFNDLAGDDEVLEDNRQITVNNVGTDQQIAVSLNRAKAWGSSFLAQYVSGEDPMAVIGNMVAEFWVRKEQQTILKILDGLFTTGGAINTTHLNGQGTTTLDNDMIIDTVKLLGDAYSKVSTMVVHSHVFHKMRKLDLINFIQPSDLSLSQPTYMGMRVIIDDGVPETAGSYTTYMFAPGAFSYAYAALDSSDATEVDRDSLRSEDVLINRRRVIYHPNGFKFTSNTVTDSSPTNADLALAANWSLVYDAKNVPVVALQCGAA